MEDIFRRLGKAGVRRGSLYLAWDFTVSSERGLTKRLLSIRDRSFAELGDPNLRDLKVAGGPPAFTVTGARDIPGIGRRVSGTVAVPCWLNNAGCLPGGRFKLGRDGLPVRTAGNVQQARFVCVVPNASAATPARPLLFGHGLFQDASAVDSVALLAQVSNAVICGTDFSGMSSEDLQNARGRVGRPVALPHAGRPPPAGDPQLHVPRPADGAPAGTVVQPRVRRADRYPAALLRRGQPGRDHRRRAHLRGARLRPLGADRAGAALQPAAHAQHPVHDFGTSSTASTRTRSTSRS